MPLTVSGRNGLLDTGKGAFTHVSALTTITPTPTEGATTRQPVTWGAAASGAAASSGALTIPIGAGPTVVAIALYSALTAGNFLGYFPVGSSGQYIDGVATASTTGGVFTSVAHGLVVDDRVFFSTIAGESVPVGATYDVQTIYWVKTVTADTFTIATSQGGTLITFSQGGEAAFFKTVPNTFASAGNLTIASGSLTLDATFV